MRSKKPYIILAVLVIAGLLVYSNYDHIKFYDHEYKIVDDFIDTTQSGIFSFVFVNLNKVEKDYIKFINRDIVRKYDSSHDTLNKKIIITHFYNYKNTVKVSGKMHKQLKLQYPGKKDLEERLRIANDAYIYTYFNYGRNISDSLFRSPVIVPKPGIKAKDIFK